jgi:prepilin-type N-terminal cleavage/methylation domain-containing protein
MLRRLLSQGSAPAHCLREVWNPMSRRGFTLIELLIVVVIIGILAAIAIPKFSSTKGKAYIATMKSDLKNLTSAQESYYYDYSVYYNGAVPNASLLFSPTVNVSITMVSGDVSGWSATSAYAGIANTCAVFVGTAAPLAPATVEGSPACN